MTWLRERYYTRFTNTLSVVPHSLTCSVVGHTESVTVFYFAIARLSGPGVRAFMCSHCWICQLEKNKRVMTLSMGDCESMGRNHKAEVHDFYQ